MYVSEEHIAEMKRAYRVIGAPLSATPSSIKQAYRRLVKRWHPDLYKGGTEEYAEATQMTKLINESYALIGDAPLRFYADAYPTAYATARQAARPAQRVAEVPKVDSILKFTWLEFWVRFICGAVFGALFGFRAFIFQYQQPRVFAFGIIASAVVFAIAATYAGDKFWHAFFGRWWMWW